MEAIYFLMKEVFFSWHIFLTNIFCFSDEENLIHCDWNIESKFIITSPFSSFSAAKYWFAEFPKMLSMHVSYKNRVINVRTKNVCWNIVGFWQNSGNVFVTENVDSRKPPVQTMYKLRMGWKLLWNLFRSFVSSPVNHSGRFRAINSKEISTVVGYCSNGNFSQN